jgi:hypothetical protein
MNPAVLSAMVDVENHEVNGVNGYPNVAQVAHASVFAENVSGDDTVVA